MTRLVDIILSIIEWAYRGGFIRRFWFWIVVLAALFAVYYGEARILRELGLVRW
jgi:hypothetical protein